MLRCHFIAGVESPKSDNEGPSTSSTAKRKQQKTFEVPKSDNDVSVKPQMVTKAAATSSPAPSCNPGSTVSLKSNADSATANAESQRG